MAEQSVPDSVTSLADLAVDGAHEMLLTADTATAISAATAQCYDEWHGTPNRDAYVGVAMGRAGRAAVHAVASKIYEAGVAAGRAQAAADLRTMADGFQALAKLDEHSYSAGIPFVPYGGRPGSWCGPCSKFAAALLRHETPAEALHLRCSQAQAWQQQVDAAVGLVKSIEEAP